MTVSCGVNFTLAVGENGGLWAWGNDINRNLDRGPTVPDDTLLQLQIHTPERVFKNRTQGVALRGVVAVSAVYRHSACVTETGELWMWGDGHWGQIGQGAPQSQNISKCIPRAQHGGVGVAMVSCADMHTLVLTADGRAWSCGSGEYGKLGHSNPPEEQPILDFLKFVETAALVAGDASTLQAAPRYAMIAAGHRHSVRWTGTGACGAGG